MSSMTPLTSRSMLSAICFAVRALPVILMTGAMGLPVGVPRPVVKTTTCAPPPTMPVTDSTSSPGVSITVRPGLRDPAGVRHDVDHGRSLAALVGRAERLLLDRRQPAADVAGRRLRAADVETERERFRLDAIDHAQELAADLRLRRARGEHVLGAHDLGDLAQHRRAAEIDESIRDASERRIRRQPGRVVRSAALQRENQRRRRRPLAARVREARGKALGDLTAAPDRPQRAAFLLDRNRLDRLPRPARGLGEMLRDHLLAAERHDEHGADVGMLAVGRERLVREAHVGPELAAAGEVRQRHDRRRRDLGDALADDGGADHGRDDEHVIAHADAAVGPRIAPEARPLSHDAGRVR